MSKITAQPVERGEDGHWTHPAYQALFGEREAVSPDEFAAWEKSHGIETAITYLDSDDDQVAIYRYFEMGDTDLSDWNPTPPTGEGWFIGSIHDTEDGPVCVWLRDVEGGAV